MTAPATPPYQASAEQVHVAVLRDGLWSPLCSDERGWVAPLANPDYIGQVTCETCLYDSPPYNASSDQCRNCGKALPQQRPETQVDCCSYPCHVAVYGPGKPDDIEGLRRRLTAPNVSSTAPAQAQSSLSVTVDKGDSRP